MSKLDDFRPVVRNTSQYQTALEAWLETFAPGWYPILPGGLLRPPPAEQAIWEAGESIARRMVANVARTNAVAWRALVARGTPAWQSKLIFRALQTEMQTATGARMRELVVENTKLIAALPDLLSAQTALYVAREQQRGRRSAEIAIELKKRLPLLRRSEAKLLARSGVARAETALTQARSERLQIKWYEWATSEDQRVRPSHRHLDKVLVAWADPPSPEALIGQASYGHFAPGEARWCRCVALPLVDLNEVRWPHKVYAHGSISLVSRSEFERFVGAAAA